MGSGCGSVGREVASISEVRGSNPAIGKIFIESLLSTVLKFEEDENKKKKHSGNGPFLNNLIVHKHVQILVKIERGNFQPTDNNLATLST